MTAVTQLPLNQPKSEEARRAFYQATYTTRCHHHRRLQHRVINAQYERLDRPVGAYGRRTFYMKHLDLSTYSTPPHTDQVIFMIMNDGFCLFNAFGPIAFTADDRH
jgi:hypothetical protein